jgi:hypothetical protein
MRPDACWEGEKSDDNLFGRFIGSPSFITINTATIVFPWSTLKSGAKKNGDLLECPMRIICAAHPELC